jgi:hypothetical protein
MNYRGRDLRKNESPKKRPRVLVIIARISTGYNFTERFRRTTAGAKGVRDD